MLTVCFDGGGKDSPKYNVLSVAGFASFAGIWEQFTERWNERLTRDGLPYFHAGDFAHSRGPFEIGWKGNEQRRQSLASDLMSIIEECGLRKFGCVIRIDDYKGVLKKHSDSVPAWPLLDAFSICAMKSIESFHAFAKGEGITNNVRYVFEKGDPEDVLRLILRGHGFADPDFAWSKPHVDNKGFSYDPFVGLQAAGWIAYEYYLDADRLLFSGPSDRWALKKFEAMPGFVTVLHHKELAPDIPSLTEYMQRQVEAVRDAAFWLEYIKRCPEIIGGPEVFAQFRNAVRAAITVSKSDIVDNKQKGKAGKKKKKQAARKG